MPVWSKAFTGFHFGIGVCTPGRHPPGVDLTTKREASSDKATGEHRLLDSAFDVSIILKGLDGLIEVIGGILLLVVSPAAINALAVRLTRHELSQDPRDFFARHLLHATGNLAETRTYAAIYLLAHGMTKIVLVVALLKGQRWAYPATIAFLAAFIAYQAYQLIVAPTAGLWALTGFDVVVLALVWREYQVTQNTTPSTRSVQGST